MISVVVVFWPASEATACGFREQRGGSTTLPIDATPKRPRGGSNAGHESALAPDDSGAPMTDPSLLFGAFRREAVRPIQTPVPSDRRAAVVGALDGLGVEYLLAEEAGGRDAVIAHVPVPGDGVEPVLDELREAGLDQSARTVVTDADTRGMDLDAIEERYAEGPRATPGGRVGSPRSR
jgi:hypothetical protein